MKADFRAKFLSHLTAKKENQGFTLIELLVVIIIIGILSAIALPSFLNQANKARASEAKSYIGSMNRAQQAYILENDGFVTTATDFAKLGLGIATETKYYTYGVTNVGTTGAQSTGIPRTPDSKPAILKAYSGTVMVGQTAGGGTGEATTLAILCESIDPQKAAFVPAAATADGPPVTKLTCPTDKQKQID